MLLLFLPPLQNTWGVLKMVFWDPGIIFWSKVLPSYEVLSSGAMSSLGSDEVNFKLF